MLDLLLLLSLAPPEEQLAGSLQISRLFTSITAEWLISGLRPSLAWSKVCFQLLPAELLKTVLTNKFSK